MGEDERVVPVFFLSDSTGISAETMGNALLLQFPDLKFERSTIPFIAGVEQAREIAAMLDEPLGLFDDHFSHLHMTRRRFIEG